MKTDVVIEAKTQKYHLRYWDKLTWAARINRKKENESEIILWNKLLRRKQLGYKFVRQKPIYRFIADFYCSELCLVIEVDGGSHNKKKENDELRDKYFKAFGITTIRVSDKDVIENIDIVKNKIMDFISSSPVKGRIKEGFNI
jgi:very-short-patch-repair endonuclease